MSKCPEEYKDWKVYQLCESEPTSFVYEGGILSQMTTSLVTFYRSMQEVYPFGPIQRHLQGRMFRNSFCASCNAVAWLGCRVKKSFLSPMNDETTIKNLIRYKQSVEPYMFVFRTDLNRRTCTFDSDGYITTPNSVSGLDTCKRIATTLKSCPCGWAYDFLNQSCTQMNNSDDSITCTLDDFTSKAQTVSTYTREICNIQDFSFIESCQNSSTTSDTTFYDFCTYLPIDPCDKAVYGPPFVHCDSRTPFVCYPPTNKTGCYVFLYSDGLGSSMGRNAITSKFALLNSIAIAYESIDFEFFLNDVENKVVAGLELLFGLFSESKKATCSKFSEYNDSFSSFMVCPDRSLVHRRNGDVYGDYILQQNRTYVCVEYSKIVFKLEVYHYVLCGLSVLSVTIYIGWYLIWADKSLTGHFFISQLTTLMLALICYCLITEAKPWPVACKLVAYLVQYLFLSVHSWTNVLAVWMFRGLSTVRLVRRSGKRVFLMYALYAWISPLPFVVLSFVLDTYPVNKLYPVFSESFCFLSNGWVRVLLFTGPIYAQILLDVGLCIWAAVIITRSGSGLTSTKSKENYRMKIISVVKLLVIFGLQWFLLFFTEINSPHVKHLWTVLNVLVTLQGVLITLSQVLNRKNLTKLSTIRSKSVKSNLTATNSNNSQSAANLSSI